MRNIPGRKRIIGAVAAFSLYEDRVRRKESLGANKETIDA